MNTPAAVNPAALATSATLPPLSAPRHKWASAYARLGLALVPIPPSMKGPRGQAWPAHAITDARKAADYWRKNPAHNMGAILGLSRIVSFDVDAPEHARRTLAAAGFDLDAILTEGVAVVGNPAKAKRFYLAPDGEALPVHKLLWPPDPKAAPDKHGKRKGVMVLELRAGAGLQDVVPPSIHPDTKRPYRFLDDRDPWTLKGFPPVPGDLLRLWKAWPDLADKLRASCPWKAAEQKELCNGERRLTDVGEWTDVRREILRRLPLREVLQRIGVVVRDRKFSCPIHPPDKNPSAWTWRAADGGEYLVCAHGGDANGCGVVTASGFLMLDALALEAFRRNVKPGVATVDLARELAIPLPGARRDDARPAATTKADDGKGAATSAKGEGERQKKKSAELLLLYDLAHGAGAELFRDQHGKAYARLPKGEYPRNVPVGAGGFRRWLARTAGLEHADRVFRREHFGAVELRLEAEAVAPGGTVHALDLRAAKRGEAFYFDVGDGRVVCIRPDGWRMLDAEPAPMFRHSSTAAAAFPSDAKPAGGGKLRDLLAPYFNVADEPDARLLLVYLVSGFVPEIEVPILALYGPYGTGKSTLMRRLARLLDPQQGRGEFAGLVRNLRTPDDFAVVAYGRRVLYLDNRNSLPGWLSDELCTYTTGATLTKRQNYTDADVISLPIRGLGGVNGITLPASAPDLLSRSLIVTLDKLTDEGREDTDDFASHVPEILGAIFDTLAAAMRAYPNIVKPGGGWPRMAEWTRWGMAIAEALSIGADIFLEDYRANIGAQHEAALEASIVAEALIPFIIERKKYEGTAADLLRDLTAPANAAGIDTDGKRSDWPHNPRVLSGELRRIVRDLATAGIEATPPPKNPTGGRGRVWTFGAVEADP